MIFGCDVQKKHAFVFFVFFSSIARQRRRNRKKMMMRATTTNNNNNNSFCCSSTFHNTLSSYSSARRARSSAKASSSSSSSSSFSAKKKSRSKSVLTKATTGDGDDEDDEKKEVSKSNDAVDNALFGRKTEDEEDGLKKTKKKQLGSKGVNLFDPAATLSRALTKRFGIVGGLSLVAVLALVEGGEIVKSLLEIDKDVDEQSETVSESGLKIKDVRIGGGGMPNKGNFVGVEVKMSNAEDPNVVYVDTKKTGKPIAFIYKSGKPLLTPLCEGIVEGVSTMKRGGIRELRIPAEKLGFGANDVVLADGTTKIPGGTDLFVRLELVDVTSYYQ
jgi:hypothetical protein